MEQDVAVNFVLKRNKRHKNGFTLIEVLLTVVILAVGLFGLMILYYNSTRNIMEGDINLMASFLVRERLEQLIGDKVNNGYASLTNASYTTTSTVSVGNHFFTRSFNIYEVNKTDLSTPLVGSGYKRIDMTVSWGMIAGQNITVSTLLTDY